MPPLTTRHATTIAAVLLVLSVAAAVAAIGVALVDSAGADLMDRPAGTAAELLCFGVVGAILIARRPDLPFGWLLGIGAASGILLVGVGMPSLALAQQGRGGQLAMWGVCLGVLQWIPVALYGVINVRFPSGRPVSALGRGLDRCLRYGIPVGLIGNYLGDTVITDVGRVLDRPLEQRRFIDGTWLTPVGNATTALIPLLILLGVLAGIGVIVRCFRASGIERKQLQWRAAGAVLSLVLFPVVVFGPLPAGAYAVEPFVFVATLMIPVLRYQLWSGDPLPRRRRVGLLVSRRTMIEAQEEERRRLRRDLHDGLGPLLTGLRLNLDAVQTQMQTDPDRAREYLAAARKASAEVIADLRGLVYGLRPPALDELGLAAALRMQLTSLTEKSPVQLALDLDEVPGLPAAVEVAVYRTAAEAVTNVVRHSDAQHCRIAIRRTGDDVVLTADDDGYVGDTWHAGVGLTSMRERAVELGGTFLASSGPDGFHITATYPGRQA